MPVPANRVPVRVARGTYANLSAEIASLQEGEVCYATDQDRLYIVEGGVLVATGADLSTSSIDALSDVDTTTAAPTTNQVLTWNGTNWVPLDAGGAVESVAGKTGVVALELTDNTDVGSASYSGLLMDFDGGNGSTTFVDSTSKITGWTVNGTATQSTTQVKYGTSSYRGTDAGSAYIESNNLIGTGVDTLLSPGTGDFTFEFWVFFPTGCTTNFQNVFTFEDGGGSNHLYRCAVKHAGAGTSGVIFYVDTGTGNNTGNSISQVNQSFFSYDTWHHVAISRASTTMRLFVDGVQNFATFNDRNIGSALQSTLYWRIGHDVTTASDFFDGYLDNLYYINSAKYTGAFTPGQALASGDPPTDGQVLTWVDANSRWQPATATGAVDSVNGQTGVVSLAIDDITDVNTSPLAAGPTQTYDTYNNSWPTITQGQWGSNGSDQTRLYMHVNDNTGTPFTPVATNGTNKAIQIWFTSGTTDYGWVDYVVNVNTLSGDIKEIVMVSPAQGPENPGNYTSVKFRTLVPGAATDGDVLTWNDANGQWQPATATGAVDSVNGKTGVVSLAVIDMSDVSYTPAPLIGYRYAVGTVSFPGNGLWFVNSARLSWGGIDADANDISSLMAGTSGSIWWSYDGIVFNEVTFSGAVQGPVTNSYYIDIVTGTIPNTTGDLYLSFTNPALEPGDSLNDGDVLAWNETNSMWESGSLRTLLGIGEYVDDAAAGTGGVASGAMYYNTTSSDYRLKA